MSGFKYFVTFVDNYSNFVTAVPIKLKSEVTQEFMKYQRKMEAIHNVKIREFQTDNAKDYVNNVMKKHLEENGKEHRRSVPYVPAQNGLAERCNQTQLNSICCML